MPLYRLCRPSATDKQAGRQPSGTEIAAISRPRAHGNLPNIRGQRRGGQGPPAGGRNAARRSRPAARKDAGPNDVLDRSARVQALLYCCASRDRRLRGADSSELGEHARVPPAARAVRTRKRIWQCQTDGEQPNASGTLRVRASLYEQTEAAECRDIQSAPLLRPREVLKLRGPGARCAELAAGKAATEPLTCSKPDATAETGHP